ncbi:threonine synthase [Rhodohalobacter sp. SW132]|uniref:threonine synthase n=1 Tax=Rhodohalobacter sp. SW132 TaxID=2293433 RepID=UPI000E2780F2|nr:threonine synthase [Rhodohalobacter sp. SW132]REL33407.1 threonine synthase [Rhodohalobacter sp. SW132]
MRFFSTGGQSPEISFLKAAEQGLAPDGGLYMPTEFPSLPLPFDSPNSEFSLQQLAKICSYPFLDEDLSSDDTDRLIDDAINFEAPLVQLSETLFILELFHGPTLAFKDFGARFMARLFSAHRTRSNGDLVILVATSGDTGGAVAGGFYDLPGVQVCLLYPEGKVSDLQRKQMTTLGKNVTALEISGTFDDCQKLVKQAFSDQKLNNALNLSSANSINIARLLPQSFYYLHAFFQLKKLTNQTPVFSVPSGNFGNLTAGLFAEKMGMPVKKFIAATNRNDVVPQYLSGTDFKPRPSIQTISNAMDVGNPSNFSRIRSLFDGDDERIRKHIFGTAYSDEQTRKKIGDLYQEFGYIADPHTAVGVLALDQYREQSGDDSPAIVLSTAHPSKFADVVEEVIGREVEIPERLKKAKEKEEKSIPMDAGYDSLKEFLTEQYG